MSGNLLSSEAANSSRKLRLAEMLVLAAFLVLIVAAGKPVQGQTYTVLHQFNFGNGDGVFPAANVVRDPAGNLYGTTRNGGALAGGTVFKIDSSGNETVLHNFSNLDGYSPSGNLILDPSGNLYGTTTFGGAYGAGTVFEMDPSGNETVLHNLSYTEGGYPFAGLVRDQAGNLYGTTVYGGAGGMGTVFEISASGNFMVLHNFAGGVTDGANPFAGLVLDANGNLYGVTYNGGASGMGTVFKIDTSLNATTLYSFTGGNDGANPYGGLALDSAGDIYGTTYDGGASGFGTVFKLDPSGNETTLHTFGSTDGANPYGGVSLDATGNLYGTTFYGGSAGVGDVFKVDPSGNFTVLHTFNATDGAQPYAGILVDSSGNLYGATTYGGSYGYGTVYEIVQTIPFSAFAAQLEITSGFELKADFSLGVGGSPINPATQGMTLTIGTYSVTFPVGAFQPSQQGWFEYDGTINGGSLRVRLTQTGANSYELMVHAQGVNLGSPTNPVTMKLSVGNNSGTTQIDAH